MNPSQLPVDVDSGVAAFALRLRDEVARPLFSAEDVAAFAERLPDDLVRGATLRFRWLNDLTELPAKPDPPS